MLHRKNRSFVDTATASSTARARRPPQRIPLAAVYCCIATVAATNIFGVAAIIEAAASANAADAAAA